jgi:hypothetical protein
MAETLVGIPGSEYRGIYTIAQVPIAKLFMIEGALTNFMLELGVNAPMNMAADRLLNILCLQEELIIKQFKECSLKSPEGLTLQEYIEELGALVENADTRYITTPLLRRVAHNANKIFDAYMDLLNDKLPMERRNPKIKLAEKIFAMVPNANPEKLVKEYERDIKKRKKRDKILVDLK